MIIKAVSPCMGELRDNIFMLPVRVYYEDTDAGGIVYYANYLKFAERARTEFIRALGVRQQDNLEEEDKFGFAVKHCEIDYKSPAILDDELVVTVEVLSLKGASVTMHQEIRRGDEVLAEIDITVVYLSLKQKRPVRIPKELVLKIEQVM